jgi:triacylglycerol lipase
VSEEPAARGETHRVLLVPGFFGFGKLGDIAYFNGVREKLAQSFARLGIGAEIIELTTLPTASIRERAARVVEALAEVAVRGGPIHIIGHSTGGLDARLALAPTASLPTRVTFDRPEERVQSLITVSCPHFGTPAATFFSGALGRRLLRVGTRYLIWLLSHRFLLRLTLALGYFVVKLRDPFGKRRGTFDEFKEKLFDDFSDDRRRALLEFLEHVGKDQSLLFQLTPAGCDLLNACTADPKVRYGSVVTRAPAVTWRSLLRSTWDLYTQLMHPLYGFLRFVVSRGESRVIPPPVPAQEAKLVEAYGELPSARDNDGLVPTNSQVWGELIHATVADHLDVVGKFGSLEGTTWAGDWIPSYSGFDAARFEALWDDVARFIARGAGEEPKVGTERTERDLA